MGAGTVRLHLPDVLPIFLAEIGVYLDGLGAAFIEPVPAIFTRPRNPEIAAHIENTTAKIEALRGR